MWSPCPYPEHCLPQTGRTHTLSAWCCDQQQPGPQGAGGGTEARLETWKPPPNAPTLHKACEAQSRPPGSRSSKGVLPAGSKGPTGSALCLNCMPPGTSQTMTNSSCSHIHHFFSKVLSIHCRCRACCPQFTDTTTFPAFWLWSRGRPAALPSSQAQLIGQRATAEARPHPPRCPPPHVLQKKLVAGFTGTV